MKNDFLDIVAVIVRQMAEDDGAGLRDRNIIDGLLDEGYDLMDIDDALSWFESLSGGGEDLAGGEFWSGFRGIRIQAKWERDAMSPAAYAYLMKLNTAGFIDDSFREAIMDKIVDLAIPDFGVDQMRALLGLVMYSQGKLINEMSLSRLADHTGPIN